MKNIAEIGTEIESVPRSDINHPHVGYTYYSNPNPITMRTALGLHTICSLT